MKMAGIISAIIAGGIVAVLFLDSCRKKEIPAPAPRPVEIPTGFPQTFYDLSKFPVTEKGFLLGRKLFYDKRLSIDNSKSCGSCHEQAAAFTTYDHDRSHGINGSHTLRNAPALFNLAWDPVYFLDSSQRSLESVIITHIQSPVDMGESMAGVAAKISADAEYKKLFREAFGQPYITPHDITSALKQFLVSLVSANSKYDKVMKGSAGFSSLEQTGYQLFKTNCAGCHKEPLFTDHSFRNIGLPVNNNLLDYGKMLVTKNPSDSLKFRTPSLRNLGYSAYFTHDGRFSSFRMVIRHYRNGPVVSATLDPKLLNGIILSDADEDALVAFIQTLNDTSFVNNPVYHE